MRRPSLDELTSAECWARLSTGSLGRISVTVAALPVVVPVFYAVMDESIVFRCPPRTRLAAATTRSVVAFEVGEYADETGHGWSVMAQGVASSITSPAVLERARQLPLAPMGAVHEDDRFVAVEVATIRGRTFTGGSAGELSRRAWPGPG